MAEANHGANSQEASDQGVENLSFEEALERLEEVVHDLEEGQLGLSQSLQRYEEGVRYLKHCHDALEKAERKIMLLAGGEGEEAELEPFDEEQLSLEEKQQSRSRRRSRSNRRPPESD